jgi:hypothetical protein
MFYFVDRKLANPEDFKPNFQMTAFEANSLTITPTDAVIHTR